MLSLLLVEQRVTMECGGFAFRGGDTLISNGGFTVRRRVLQNGESVGPITIVAVFHSADSCVEPLSSFWL